MSRGAAVLDTLPVDPNGTHKKDLERAYTNSVHEKSVGFEHDNVPRRTGIFAPMWRLMDVLEASYGVEARGIERVPEDQRHHARIWDNFTMWAAANCTISTFALGTLGNSIWFLGFRDAVLTIIFFNLLSTAPVAYFATFGKSSGLRQMCFGRYSFGYFVVYIPTILNLIACIGWSCINSIAGGQALKAVSTSHQIPMTPAIIIIAVLTLVVSFFGYKTIHLYERYSWIPVTIIFLILLGQSARFMESGPWGGTGDVEAASVLSFGAAIVGFGLGWVSLAADYTVNMPVDASNHRLFWYTYIGLNLPLILVEVLGAAMMTTFNEKTTWADAYAEGSVGGLLGAGLRGPMGGFGGFLMVILALSIVANNIPNMYSFAMTFQVLGPYAQAIPRPLISLAATIIYAVLACVGADSFDSVLDNLLLFLSYWLAIYSVILLEEHFIFRKANWANYEFEDYANWRNLPLGAAALGAVATGWVGAVMGMSTTFFVGPIALKFGLPGFGGDIGFELAIGFSALTYAPLRYLERKHWGH